MKKRFLSCILCFGMFMLFPVTDTSLVFAQTTGGSFSELTLDDDDDYLQEPLQVYDPWEKLNRRIFKFNDWTYRKIFNPIADVYDFILPNYVQQRLNGVIHLSRSPIRIFNNLFQGKLKSTSMELGRLVVNSTVGLAGMYDPAGHFLGWEAKSEDFGQTLGVWGMDSGRFFVIPFLGPTNTRDIAGRILDRGLSPFTWFSVYDVENETAFEIFKGVRYAHRYAYDTRDDYEAITEDALDDYVSIRHLYNELRMKKIQDEGKGQIMKWYAR